MLHALALALCGPASSSSHAAAEGWEVPAVLGGDSAEGGGPAQRLQMVACDGARALNLSAASLAKGQPGMLRAGQSCVSIHNMTTPGTCGDATGTACALVLRPCDRADAAMQWLWRSDFGTPSGGHLCTATGASGPGSDCVDRAHIPADFTTLHVSLYTTRPSNHAWHLLPSPRRDGTVLLVSNCLDAVCKQAQCVGLPPTEAPAEQEPEPLEPPTFGNGLRSLWYFSENFTDMNHGFGGMTPRHVHEAQTRYVVRRESNPAQFGWGCPTGSDVSSARNKVADYIGATSVEDLVMVENAM